MRIRLVAWLGLAAFAAYGAAPVSAVSAQLPNLEPLAPSHIEIGLTDPSWALLDDSPAEPALLFQTSVANRSENALDIEGVPDPSADNPLTLEAMQCVDWVSDYVCGERQAVGKMQWHQAHQHWHFERYALHELRLLNGNGTPNMTPAGLVASGGKASFCLEDVERDDDPPPSLRVIYENCTGFRQGISPHWRDVYNNQTPGQDLPLAELRDGEFALVLKANPDHLLQETSYDDNVAWTVIRLSHNLTQVDVLRSCAPTSHGLRCEPAL